MSIVTNVIHFEDVCKATRLIISIIMDAESEG